MTKKERNKIIDVGSILSEVSSVNQWYKGGHFNSDEKAKGAFFLAYQQGMDGMGKSIAEWMGLSSKEYDAWMRNGELPKKSENG
jgi:hypothetical protein